jgi:hypothetical protein
MSTAAREGLMREHEAGRPRTPRRWQPWIKRIRNVATHVSAASLLASGMATSLAARKPKNRHDDRGARDQGDRDRDGRNDRNREDRQANDAKDDRETQRESRDGSPGDGDGRHSHQRGKQEPQGDESRGVHSEQNATATPTPTPTPTDGGGGGGGGRNRDGGGGGNNAGGGGGGGDGGGNEAGNAGSGFFDRPLATKARRRSNDFDNADRDEDDGGVFVDVDPEGESVYETESVALITGPDGIEILTDNISYFAEPTPTPEPLPRLELPEREPGFPFGEDFPFGDESATVRPSAREPADPGDTGTTVAPRAEPISDSSGSETANSDGGDNTMDFTS